MSVQLRHPTIRNMKPLFLEMDHYLESHRIGMGLSGPDGLLLTANDRFLEKIGQIPLQTTPLHEILRVWQKGLMKGPADLLEEWLLPRTNRTDRWERMIPDIFRSGSPNMELMRIPLALSRNYMLYMFQPGFSSPPVRLIDHFQFLKNSLSLILLDLLDHASLLQVFRERPPMECDSVILASMPRYQAGSAFLRITPSGMEALESSACMSLRSIPVQETETPRISRRGFFSRDATPPGLPLLNLPLFGESSFYGWAIASMSTESPRGSLYRKKTEMARNLSFALHANRSDLQFVPLLEKDRTYGFYSERGILRILQDLMSPEGTGETFALVGLSLNSLSGVAPLEETLSRFARATDMLGKISPKEYVLIVMEAKENRAQKALTRLLGVLHSRAKDDYRLTLGIGMAVFPDPQATPLRMLRSALMRHIATVGESHFLSEQV